MRWVTARFLGNVEDLIVFEVVGNTTLQTVVKFVLELEKENTFADTFWDCTKEYHYQVNLKPSTIIEHNKCLLQ